MTVDPLRPAGPDLSRTREADPMPTTTSARSMARVAALCALAFGLAGCQDYFARRDTISFHAGDSVAANRAVHVIDPWPAAAADTTIPVNGRKAIQAIERYEGRGGEPAAAAAQSFVPMVPMAPGGAPPAQ